MHYYQLKQAGADFIVKETYHAALELGSVALSQLGFHPFRAHRLKRTFVALEDKMAEDMYQSWLSSTEEGMGPGYRELFMQQEALLREGMQDDRVDHHSAGERGWNPPPKGYANNLDDTGPASKED